MFKRIVFCALLLQAAMLNAVAQKGKSDSLVKELVKTSELDTMRVKTLIALADQLSNEALFIDALRQIEIGKELAESLSYTEGIAKASLYEGIIQYRSGEYANAVPSLLAALPSYEFLKDKEGTALTHHWLGNTYYNLGNYEKALDHYLQSFTIREALNDKKGMSFTLSNIGNVFKEQQEYGKALDYYLKSLELKKGLNDERSVGVSYNNIASVYAEMRQYDKAMEYSKSALAIFLKLKDDRRAAFAWGNIGEIYEKQEQYQEALKPLMETAKILERVEDAKALAEALNHIGNVQMQLQQYGRAEDNLLKAQKSAIRAEASSELMENYHSLARLDSAQGKMTEAYRYMRLYISLKEKVFNAEKSKQITQMQAAFDSERKDKAIELLEQEKNYQKTRMVLFIIAVAVLLMIAFGLIYFLRVKNKANEILKSQKKQLEELNQLKDKLFSIIAHDLRSPLQSLKGVLNLAGKEAVSGEELKYLLGAIGKNTQNTIDLVDNLINWSKDNLQGSTINPERFDLREPVETNTKLLAQQYENKNIHISNNLVKEHLVNADKNMIDLVLRNLISNAIKFTPQGGSISISSKEEQEDIILRIEDTGVGISREQQTKLFGTSNYSTHGTAHEKGTGLGLILCKEFVEKNGGRIWVESELGKGSRFCFSLLKIA
jgi:two-component system sensor histidine kinase/response regulator